MSTRTAPRSQLLMRTVTQKPNLETKRTTAPPPIIPNHHPKVLTRPIVIMIYTIPLSLLLTLFLASSCCAFQPADSETLFQRKTTPTDPCCVDRRSFGTVIGFSLVSTSMPHAGIAMPSLDFYTTPSGLQWADAKVGSGAAKQIGDLVAVDYVLSTTGARYGSKIYSTQSDPNSAVVQSSGFDAGAPYRWTLGDGTTIAGLEQAILGDSSSGMPAMLPGGIRRVIIPPSLAYQTLAGSVEQANKCETGIGPVPPPSTAFDAFQRFKNVYCNPFRPYQPDVVMDIKLYGKRQ